MPETDPQEPQTTLKRCTECGFPKPESAFSPANSRRHPHLRRGQCKTCRALLATLDRKASPEKHRMQDRQRYMRDGEKRRAAGRAYHARSYPHRREEILEKRRPKW